VVAHPDLNEPLFSTPEIILRRGERAALIGPNGAGKTTFLRTLLGELAPLEGSVRLGEGLELGYFEQAHASLNTDNTILEELLEADPTLKRSEARNFLAQLLFTGEEVDKSVAILSGGERGRLALAKLILEGANFLLLDEPTNHLDLPSQESLEEALKHFPGTILLVSHDRYLVESLVDQIWSISPGDQALQVFHGGYSAYQAHKLEVDNEVQKKDEKPRSQKKSPQKKGSKVDLHNVEARITNLENALVELGQELEGAGERVEDVVELGERYGALENELQLQLELWETLSRGTNEA
jgi:ATP-binding cassette subfamily F protein 3